MMLVKNEGSNSFSVAYNLTFADLNSLDKIIQAENLEQVNHTVPEMDKYTPELVCRVIRRTTGLPGIASYELQPQRPSVDQLRVSYNIAAVLLVNRWVSRYRNTGDRGLPCQDQIYADKLAQAQSFKDTEQDAGFYVKLEASRRGISEKAAADFIITAAEIVRGRLRFSEEKRLEFMDLASNVTSEASYVSFRNEVIATFS